MALHPGRPATDAFILEPFEPAYLSLSSEELSRRVEVSSEPAELRVVVVEGRVAITATQGRTAEVSRGSSEA